MAKQSLDDRIMKIQQRQEQLKAQEKALKARKTEAERKQRTKRLINIGASVESVLGYPLPQGERLNIFLEKIRAFENETPTEIRIAAGNIIEEIIGRPLTSEDLPNLRKYLEGQEKRGSYFSKAMKQTAG